MPTQTMGLIGRKIGMTQIFDAQGDVVPVTIVETGPCTVLRVKSAATKDKYDAIQLAYGDRKVSRTNRPDMGQFKAAGAERSFQHVRELRVDAATAGKYAAGTVLKAGDVFTVGERVDACGTSRGNGFSGVMKRHNFAGTERGHGAHEVFRHGGSIGCRLTPGMTLPNMPMPGQHGDSRVTVQNLVVAHVDAERSLVYVRGGVPGAVGSLVTIRKAVKNG